MSATPRTDALELSSFENRDDELAQCYKLTRQIEAELVETTKRATECFIVATDCRDAAIRLQAELAELNSRFDLLAHAYKSIESAPHELAASRAHVATLCDSWSEDHTAIQILCRDIGCTSAEVDGDEYGVPDIRTLLDLLRNRLADSHARESHLQGVINKAPEYGAILTTAFVEAFTSPPPPVVPLAVAEKLADAIKGKGTKNGCEFYDLRAKALAEYEAWKNQPR